MLRNPKRRTRLDSKLDGHRSAWSCRATARSCKRQSRRELLQSVAPFLAYLPESEGLARLRAMNLRGTVRDMVFTANRAEKETPLRY